jgi:hypothetical protein
LIEQKIKKNGAIWVKWVLWGKMGEKGVLRREMAGCRPRKAGGGVSVVGEVMAEGGFWILGRFGEEGRRRRCTVWWRSGGKGERK